MRKIFLFVAIVFLSSGSFAQDSTRVKAKKSSKQHSGKSCEMPAKTKKS